MNLNIFDISVTLFRMFCSSGQLRSIPWNRDPGTGCKIPEDENLWSFITLHQYNIDLQHAHTQVLFIFFLCGHFSIMASSHESQPSQSLEVSPSVRLLQTSDQPDADTTFSQKTFTRDRQLITQNTSKRAGALSARPLRSALVLIDRNLNVILINGLFVQMKLRITNDCPNIWCKPVLVI